MILKIQTIILLVLISALSLATLVMAKVIYDDLHDNILRGFDKKLFAISTVAGSFIDGDLHDKILESKKVRGMAFDPDTNILYGAHVINNIGYLVSISTDSDWSIFGAAQDIMLFSVESKFQQDLDYRNFSDALRGEFSKNQTPLSSNVTISLKKKGIEWLITDDDEKRTYTVWKDDSKLNIYRSEGFLSPAVYLADLAFNPNTKMLYGLEVSKEELPGKLVSIDPTTGAGTVVGAIGIDCRGLAFDPSTDTLYGSSNQLIKIDTRTGEATAIGPLGFDDIRGLAFDAKTKILYGINSKTNQLIIIDTKTAKCTLVGPLVKVLFSLGWEWEEHLTSGQISKNLQQALEQNEIELSKSVMVSTQSEDNAWLITNQEKKQAYFFKKEKELLFSIEPEAQSNLDIGTISGNLRRQFEKNETKLSENVAVSIEKENRKWSITDKENDQRYFIEKEENKLNVYRKYQLDIYLAESSEQGGEKTDGSAPRQIKLKPIESAVVGLAFGPNANVLYGGTDRLIKIDPGTGKVLQTGYSGYRYENSLLYKRYLDPMRRIKRERELTFLYTQILTTEEDKSTLLRNDLDFETSEVIIYALDAEDPNDRDLHTQTGYIEKDPADDKMKDVLFKGVVHLSEIKKWEEWGLLKSGFAPIFNEEGEIRGMVGADVNVDKIQEKTNFALLKVCLMGTTFLLLAGLMALYITRKLIAPIRQLKEAALRVAAGDYGHEILVRTPMEMAVLSKSFNEMSRTLKTEVEDLTQENRSLESKRLKQELTRTLNGLTDERPFRQPEVLAHTRIEGKPGYQDSSGWALWEGTYLFWLADSPEDPLQAIKLRLDISIVVNLLLQRFVGDRDSIFAKLEGLFKNTVYGFVMLDPSSGSVHAHARRSVSVMLIDEKKEIRYYDLAERESIMLSPDHTLIMSSVNSIVNPNRIAAFKDLASNLDTNASHIISAFEEALMNQSQIDFPAKVPLTNGVLTVMVRPKRLQTTAQRLSRLESSRGVPLFANLNDEDLIWINNDIVTEEVYSPGETIFKENDEGDALYIIVAGSIRVIKGRNRRVTLAILREGDVFGEMGILDQQPRSATIEVESRVRVLTIKRDDFQRLIVTKSQIASVLLKTLVQRLRDTTASILNED